jgi:hypothetical protein
MKAMIPALFHTIASVLRERCDLLLEMLALRHQLAVLERSVKRPQFSPPRSVCVDRVVNPLAAMAIRP